MDTVPTTAETLFERLNRERVLSLTEQEWEAASDAFEVVENHATGIAGDLIVARGPSCLVAVETPPSGGVVVRRLDDPAAAARFVAGRLAAYDRMWDGCGCRIHYLDPGQGGGR